MSSVKISEHIFNWALSLAFFFSANVAFSSNLYGFSNSLPSAWEKQTPNSAGELWLLRGSPNHATIATSPPSVSEYQGDSQEIESYLKQKNLKTTVEKIRSEELSVVGIKGWKLDNTLVSHVIHGNVLEMHGHYKSVAGTSVEFTERDYFVGNSTFSISFYEDLNGSAKKSNEDVKKLLDLYSRVGGK